MGGKFSQLGGNFAAQLVLTLGHVHSRCGHGTGVPEMTPLEFCVFSDPSQKFVRNQTWIRFLFSAVAGVCVVFINVIATNTVVYAY